MCSFTGTKAVTVRMLRKRTSVGRERGEKTHFSPYLFIPANRKSSSNYQPKDISFLHSAGHEIFAEGFLHARGHAECAGHGFGPLAVVRQSWRCVPSQSSLTDCKQTHEWASLLCHRKISRLPPVRWYLRHRK